MMEFTREEFKAEFGKPPTALFDLNKCLSNRKQMEIEAMGQPVSGLARLRAEYGVVKFRKSNVHYCLHVAYWISNGRFRALIQKVILFDDQAEQDLYKAKIQATGPVGWQDN